MMSAFFSLPVLPLLATETASGSPLVTFLSLMAGAALVSYAAEFIALRFGRSQIINWRMVTAIVAVAIAFVFWYVWNQQTDFVNMSIDPTNGSFRFSLWLFLILSFGIPCLMCYSAVVSVVYDRWMVGVSLFAVRILVVLAMLGGCGWMVKSVLAMLKGVRLSLFN